MSARTRHVLFALPWHRQIALVAAFACPLLGHTFTLETFLASVRTDPLQVRPGVLEAGARLPGDTRAACPAAVDLPDVLDLARAVDLALCNNPQLKLTWAGIKLQTGAAGEARSAFWPTLGVTANRLRTKTTYPDAERDDTLVNGNSLNATLNWRLYDFGTREANRRAADSLLQAALASHDANLQKTLASTIQAFFEVQSTRAAWVAKQESQQLAIQTLASAARRESLGAVARSDTLQATTALARTTLEMHRADGAYRKALSVLVYAMGVAPAGELRIAEDNDIAGETPDIAALLALPAASLRERLREAQETNPAIRAAREQSKAAQSKVEATRSEGLPTVDLSGNYYQNGYPGQALSATRSRVNTIGIALTIPIFDGFSRNYKVQQARAQAEQRDEELVDTEHSVMMDVVKAHADALSSTANLQASDTLLQAASQALTVSQRKYDKGAADILEMLTTQTALADARQERIRCLADWRSARLRLLASIGGLGIHAIVGQGRVPSSTASTSPEPTGMRLQLDVGLK